MFWGRVSSSLYISYDVHKHEPTKSRDDLLDRSNYSSELEKLARAFDRRPVCVLGVCLSEIHIVCCVHPKKTFIKLPVGPFRYPAWSVFRSAKSEYSLDCPTASFRDSLRTFLDASLYMFFSLSKLVDRVN